MLLILCINNRLFCKRRSSYKNTFMHILHSSYESLQIFSAYRIPYFVFLGLQINFVQLQFVLKNNSINPAIMGTTHYNPGIFIVAISHSNKQIDYHNFTAGGFAMICIGSALM